ncbi:extracellular solute-binding protein [Streptomyces sp. N2-109]|uniref:Extracellular solute-binding protein n=1 Tax=Streptomyces gossypii TaxID=2883101 RepID=A0ABT2JZ55_9ACTN|nr:extracellular solute-binding protein [Streptomyces gossypii]MCT2593189.1 extracellular solute-binding protein [Streptomyces gossypii]
MAIEHGHQSADSSKRYWSKLIKDFRRTNPEINVEVDVFSRAEIDDRVAEMVKQGKEPDLAQSVGSFAEYAEDGKLYNASDVLSTPAQGELITALAEAGTVRRVQYGLPFAASTEALYYNRKLFAEAGIDDPPRTWKEVREAAVALDEAGIDTPYGLPLGKQEAQIETLNWMVGGGGNYASDAGTYDIDSPQNVRTFSWLRDELVTPRLTGDDPASTSRQDAYTSFAKGEVGMLNGNSSLMGLALESGVDYGWAPLPGRTGPAKGAAGMVDWMTAFTRNGHQEEIRTFLDFVYEKKNVIDYAERHGLLPVTASASEAMREDEKHRQLWDFLDQLPNARFFPVNMVSWGSTVRSVQSSIGRAVAKDGNPRAVLGSVQRKANAAEVAKS